MPTPQQLEEIVHEALDNAIDNGYAEVETDDPDRVATDLGSCCCDVEGMDSDELVPHVLSWRHKRSLTAKSQTIRDYALDKGIPTVTIVAPDPVLEDLLSVPNCA